MITLKANKPSFTLTIDAATVTVERIGKGRFCTAYRDVASDTVYLFVAEDQGDYSKEILKYLRGTPYIPDLEYLWDYQTRLVYRTKYYPRLTAASKLAWAQYKALAKCLEDARTECTQRRPAHVAWYQDGHHIMYRTVELLRERYPESEELTGTLDTLVSWASSYGASYCFEFWPRNLGTDTNGGLILLDPIFDMETVAKDRAEHLKRHQAQYRL